MRLIQNAKVKTKLLILAITTFSLVIITDISALHGLNRLFDKIEHFHYNNAIPLNFISNMRGSFFGIRATVMDIIVTEDEVLRRDFIEGPSGLNYSLEYFANAISSYENYVNTTDSNKLLAGEAESVRILVNALDATRKSIDQILTARNQEEALALASGEFRSIAYDQVMPNVQKLNSMHLEETTLQMEEADSLMFLSIVLILGITIFNVLVFILIGSIIIRSITVPLREMIDVSENVSNGNLHINIEYHSSDELGTLADNFRNMIDTLNHLSTRILEMGKQHSAGQCDYRIDTASLKGTYQEIAANVNHNMDITLQIMDDIMANMNDLATGKFDTVVKDYPGQNQQASDSMKALKNGLLSINREISLIAQYGTAGNLSYRIDVAQFHGNWRQVMESLNKFLNAISKPIQEVSTALTQISQGSLSAHVSGDYKGDFADIQKAFNQTAQNIANYIFDISKTVEEMASNNLNVSIQREYAGDFSVIKDSLNTLIDKLNSMLNEIVTTADKVSVGAHQVAEASMQLSDGVSKQASAIESVLGDVAICAKQTAEDGQNADLTRSITAESKTNINISNQEMKNMLNAMAGIREASENISNINKVIGDIALQTNLLSLNAAVEAARAGQHGKGFAVVSEEVGNLASRSQKAASETATLIEDTVQRVAVGTTLANNTANSLQKIVDGIHSISDLMAVIEQSTQIQGAAFDRVSTGLEDISLVVQSNASTSEENASAAQVMSNQAEMLKEFVSVFKLK